MDSPNRPAIITSHNAADAHRFVHHWALAANPARIVKPSTSARAGREWHEECSVKAHEGHRCAG